MSVLSGIVGGLFTKHAAKKGANQLIANYQGAEDKSINALSGARDASIGYQQPFYEGGVNAFNRASQMQTPGFQYSPSDPSYAWRLSQGQRAVDLSAAARGGLHSGGTLKALSDYGQASGSQEFGADFARENQLATFGANAANQMGDAQQNYGSNASTAYFNGARGRSGGISDRTAANTSFIGGIQGANDQVESVLSKFFGI